MADEMWRRQIGFFNTSDDVNVVATLAVPRHVRATIQYAEFELSVPIADQTFDAWWQVTALVRGIRTEAQVASFIAPANFAQFVAVLRPLLMATKGWPDVGTPANAALIDTMVSKSRDYGNLDEIQKRALGVAIMNRGPSSNQIDGWSLVYTSFDQTLTVAGFLILEILLEWPKNISMVFAPEHVANEENQ